ncbi:outer membrane protein assembly factor BamB family protein [Cellulomonas fengjieae]|uniref:outer membrane protein assembly factor BamB family protein n=1 Tax=Cellulomonas fengjieae TaxID=2819978 RepID=UPI001AAF7DD8|nr:PQQ-binding-like beta-propeller repeat protein [Cellulomonas fengjieae]MBO3103399.1 PQQ-binding-like beta-propeller repeat protein [Cellulomonas fengjieae]
MGRRGALQQVELHEADAPEPRSAPARTRHPRRWAAGVAAVVLALGAVQWVTASREDAAQARLARVPGVLAPVDDTLEVLRTLGPQDLVTLVGEPAGTLIRGEDGAQSYRWMVPGDQGRGWTAALLGATPVLADTVRTFGDTVCTTDEPRGAGTAAADHVLCVVTDGARRVLDTGAVEEVPATSTELVVLDTADGSVVARRPLAQGTSIAALPSLAVVGGLRGESMTVTAYDPLTGEQRWTYEDAWTPGPRDASVFRAGDLIAVSMPGGELTLLSSEGAVVRDGITAPGGETPGAGWGWGLETDPRDDTLVLLGQAFDGTSRATFLAADGDPAGDVAVDGTPVTVGVDDGSVPGLLLTADRSLHAWDDATGDELWSADVRSTTTALVVRGRVVVTTERAVVALDGRSGRELWRTDELTGLTPSALLTDGAHILAALDRTGTSGVPALAAYDPATGAEQFRAPYPDGVIELGSVGRALVGRDAASDQQVELG